ncbi:hypothetical protein [Tepidibacillus decaturensis]|uniref:Uncharacterized protein n=1 Tax=Tepidibacillus decaturensis TaxID=1413211 RepID=A0A135L1J8_9BACI|nr:hypothetical protein [Tepidibacillus decaturensis]KXG42881.1 hypothetical protein U473_01675 [Tepidibacillus decaturensis]
MREDLDLKGKLTIVIENVVTGRIRTVVVDNLVILNGRNLIRDFLFGDAVTGLTHMALGTDTSEPSVTPTITEVFRKVFTSKAKADGKLTVDMYLSSTEANGYTLTSAALFGNGATDSAGTGTQYNKVIHDQISKTASLSITYTWDLYINAG